MIEKKSTQQERMANTLQSLDLTVTKSSWAGIAKPLPSLGRSWAARLAARTSAVWEDLPFLPRSVASGIAPGSSSYPVSSAATLKTLQVLHPSSCWCRFRGVGTAGGRGVKPGLAVRVCGFFMNTIPSQSYKASDWFPIRVTTANVSYR